MESKNTTGSRDGNSEQRRRRLMAEKLRKHRAIGIHYALKELAEFGLIEEGVEYPHNAVRILLDRILSKFQQGYRIGARRGALQVLQALLDGDLEIKKDEQGKLKILAHVEAIEWERALFATVGNQKHRLPIEKYGITRKQLGLE